MTDKAAEYRHRLHLLIHNEPHPETRESFASQLRWQPQPVSQTFARLFRSLTADLTNVQRLLMKMALKMPLTAQEVLYLQDLHGQGRYRCDREPELFLFCVGRRGGKTMLAARTAFLLSFLDSTAVWVPRKLFADNYDWSFAGGFQDLPEVNVFSRRNYVSRSEAFHVLDEMMIMEDWFDFVPRREYLRVVSFFSLTHSCTIPDIRRPCMALSLSGVDVYPMSSAYPIDPRLQIEHEPPPVDQWFEHSWGQDGG